MEIKTSQSYQKEVLEKYKSEKGGDLRGYLAAPTRSQIRDACIYLFNRRNEKNDEYILNRFFQFKNDENKLREIENFGEGKFRSIEKFLKGEIKSTSTKNINLISWLIDFQPRPYEEYSKSDNSISEEELIHRLEPKIIDESNGAGETNNEGLKVNQEEERKKQEAEKRKLGEIKRKEEDERKKQEEIKKKKRRKLVITISIVFGAILTTGLIFKDQIFTDGNDSPSNNETTDNPFKPNVDKQLIDNNCMTWADSLYVLVLCDKGPFSDHGTKVEPLNKIKLRNMKKVLVDAAYPFFSEDGKPLIWYYKNAANEHEFFTAPGLHPITDETLKKITPYIIQTYVPMHLYKKESFVPE